MKIDDVNPELEKLIAHEGNLKEFEYEGYKCRIIRHRTFGSLCGYVVIPFGHPWYQKDYDEIEQMHNYEVPAHGGLTFSGEVDDGSYLVGFDCAHLGDLIPNMTPYLSPNETYKDMDFVTNNLKEIIDFMKGALKV